MRTITIGVDLAKQLFSACELNPDGAVLQRRELRRDAFAAWLDDSNARFLSWRLYLNGDDVEQGRTNVRNEVRCQWRTPNGFTGICTHLQFSRIQDDLALRISAHKVAPAQHIQRGRPAMGVNGG